MFFFMNTPLVSVIVTSFNHAKFIGSALDSIYAQTWKNIEVIVVDDASTDGSQKIIKKYQRKYGLKFIERKDNYYTDKIKKGEKPIIQAMNCASGKYISVVDSDDLILPEKIERQVGLLEANPDCTLCYGGIEVLTSDGKLAPYPNIFINGDAFSRLLVNGNCGLYIGSLIRRSSYVELERSPPDLVQEDWDMFLRLAKIGPFVCDPRTVAYYRRHDNNTWYRQDKNALMYRNRMMILESWCDEPEWPDAMALRWKHYANNEKLTHESINELLLERPKDSLLHYLLFCLFLESNEMALMKKHLLLSISYCDERLSVLPILYGIASQVLNTPIELEILIQDMESRIKEFQTQPCYQSALEKLKGY